MSMDIHNDIIVHYIVHIQGITVMLNKSITNFRKNILSLPEQTIKYNEPMNVSTKDGNAVIISEDNYNSLVETICLSSNYEQREKIIEGLNTPLRECIPENKAAGSVQNCSSAIREISVFIHHVNI